MRQRSLLWLCGAIFVVSPLVRLAVLFIVPDPRTAIYVLTPTRLDGLAAGAAIAIWAWLFPGHRFPLLSRRVMLWASIGVFLVFVAFGAHAKRSEAGGPVEESLGYTVVGVLAGSMVAGALWRESAGGYLSHRVLVFFGKYSYALYVLHLWVDAAAQRFHLRGSFFAVIYGSRIPGFVVYFCAATAVSCAAAWVSWQIWERRWLQLKSRFEPRAALRKAAAA